MDALGKIKLACSIIQHFKKRNTLTIDYPFENCILEKSDDASLLNIYNEITGPDYEPQFCTTIDVPKGGGMIRHSTYLNLKDHLLYTILMLDSFPYLYKYVVKADGDAEQILNDYQVEYHWLKKYIRGGKDLFEKRKPLYEKNFQYILSADITSFSPNIDIRLLCNELLEVGCPPKSVLKLETCLRKWSPLGHKGLPQIFFTTDLLAEFYLQPIDNFFRSFTDVHYIRESDNIEIWCKSQAFCKHMLTLLARKMYERGVYLNHQKSKIIAVKDIDQEFHPLEKKKFGWKEKLKAKLPRLMSFYYKIEENTSLNECSQRLTANPDYTVALLRHYHEKNININNSLARFLSSKDAVYSYQNYAIVKWLTEHLVEKEKNLNEIIRRFAWDSSQPYYLQSASRYFIYKHGDDEDRNKLTKSHHNISNPLEFADMNYLLRETVIENKI